MQRGYLKIFESFQTANYFCEKFFHQKNASVGHLLLVGRRYQTNFNINVGYDWERKL